MSRRCPTSEFIPVEQGIIDKEYNGYITADRPNSESYCSITYKGNGVGWCWNNEERKVENITFLNKRLTVDEQEEWRKAHYEAKDPREQLNLMGLYNDMYDVGDASHEMYNAWTSIDWYEMAENLSREDFFLVGIAPAPWDCYSIDNPVAAVIEEENGTRFWCHMGKSWIDRMRKQMREIYNNMMGIEE